MIFIHNKDEEVFGYHDKAYNYFCKEVFTVETTSWEYNWVGFMKDGSIKQLAPTNLWRWE